MWLLLCVWRAAATWCSDAYFATDTLARCENFTHVPLFIAAVKVIVLAASFSLDSMIIGFTSLLAASMEDDGIASKRSPLGRASVDAVGALVGLRYLSSAIFQKTHVIEQRTGCFQGYLFSRRDQICENLENFVLKKFLAMWYWCYKYHFECQYILKKLLSRLSKAKLQKFSLHCDKIQWTTKLFSHVTFVVYGITNNPKSLIFILSVVYVLCWSPYNCHLLEFSLYLTLQRDFPCWEQWKWLCIRFTYV